VKLDVNIKLCDFKHTT